MDDRHARHRRRPPDRRRRPWTGWRASSLGDFVRLVDRAVATLPPALLERMHNIELSVEDVPPPEYADEILLGLYEGTPLPERTWDGAMMPDRIRLFRGPLEARATGPEHLRHLVATTVVHEIAHHFGIDDDRLDELGWG